MRARRRRRGRGLAGRATGLRIAVLGGIAGVLIGPATGADASAAHVVQAGETLWSISAANNLTTRTVAVFNGIPEDAQLLSGQTIQVPTVDEGAVALASAPPAAPAPTATTDTSSTAAVAPTADPSATYGLGAIWSPWGTLYLDPAAADSWNAMRQASLDQFGVDLYPDGTLSAFRTYAQQAYLYDQYLAGAGAPANPPGTSSHEYGVAVDVAEPAMRDVIDQLGPIYGWSATIPAEWWHVAYMGS